MKLGSIGPEVKAGAPLAPSPGPPGTPPYPRLCKWQRGGPDARMVRLERTAIPPSVPGARARPRRLDLRPARREAAREGPPDRRGRRRVGRARTAPRPGPRPELRP